VRLLNRVDVGVVLSRILDLFFLLRGGLPGLRLRLCSGGLRGRLRRCWCLSDGDGSTRNYKRHEGLLHSNSSLETVGKSAKTSGRGHFGLPEPCCTQNLWHPTGPESYSI